MQVTPHPIRAEAPAQAPTTPDAAWPQLPGLRPAPDAWRAQAGTLTPAEFDVLHDSIVAALDRLPPATISITRDAREVARLLQGAPRLRTIHDLVPELTDPAAPHHVQAAMRRHMETLKGTWHDGTTAYGVTLLRDPSTPAPVLDAFGGVALTLTESAAQRATYLPTDSMFTRQRPAARGQLSEVLTERLVRDAGLHDGPTMNDDALPPQDRTRIRDGIAEILRNPSRGGQVAAELLSAPDFGGGFRFVEAQIPAVALGDVARIDIGRSVSAADRTALIELAAQACIPAGA